MLICNQSGRWCRHSAQRPARWAAGILATLLPWAVQAHDPLDSSAHLTVAADRVQLTVTMGLDGVQEILTEAGLSPQERAETIASRGPKAIRELPVTLAARLFAVRSDGQTLTARGVGARSDGMEVEFHLDYPGAGGALELEAVYFDAMPAMRPGWLVAVDENNNQLLAVLLSSSERAARLVLPARKMAASSPVLATSPSSKAFSAPEGILSRSAENHAVAAKISRLPRWLAFGGVSIGCLWLVWLRRRKIKGANEY